MFGEKSSNHSPEGQEKDGLDRLDQSGEQVVNPESRARQVEYDLAVSVITELKKEVEGK